jgi:hypothetical protein
MNKDDYFVVMAYVNQLLRYLCMFRVRCKPPHVHQLNLAKYHA